MRRVNKYTPSSLRSLLGLSGTVWGVKNQGSLIPRGRGTSVTELLGASVCASAEWGRDGCSWVKPRLEQV